MSWAAIANRPAPVPEGTSLGPEEQVDVAVLDANAIIDGTGLLLLAKLANSAVTTPEVLEEVRDKRSRALLDALPYKLVPTEPAEEDVTAVLRFARATGDAHVLSRADARLIALARTLEVKRHGSARLRTEPAAPRLVSKAKRERKALPGWGEGGANWEGMERINAAEEAALQAALAAAGGAASTSTAAEADQQNAGGSRVVAGQTLDLGLEHADEEAVAAARRLAAAAAEAGSTSEEDDVAGDDSDDGGWTTAAKTPNAARKQRRRAARRAQREAEVAEAAAIEAAAAATAEPSDEESEADDSGSEDEDGASVGSEEETEAGSTDRSSVCILTADFAMQNVILQMGLRLVTPDNRRITRLSRWVLRCTACSMVSKEVGRVFCPRCGNSTMERVQLSVGPDGAEQYGVRKRHNLRGTKFPLPKPKGGRRQDLILREDVLLQRTEKARRRAQRKAATEVDPFAAEYGEDTWHQAAGLGTVASKGAAALTAGWKHNPNERKHIATNRRRK